MLRVVMLRVVMPPQVRVLGPLYRVEVGLQVCVTQERLKKRRRLLLAAACSFSVLLSMQLYLLAFSRTPAKARGDESEVVGVSEGAADALAEQLGRRVPVPSRMFELNN